jgi:Zn-dependent peptidase ImmA (M78 family)
MRADAGRLADDLAGEVIERHGMDRAPGVDPWALAAALEVPVFDYDIPEDGRVVWGEGGPVVLLTLNAGLERRRFTLAHELGHVVLRTERLSSPTLLAVQQAFRSEEVLCDALAGSLLMSRSWVHSGFARAPQDLRTIGKLARAASVSLSAALVRLREVHGWRRTLLQWRSEDGRWIYDAEAGLWPSEKGVIKPSEDTTWVLSDRRRCGATWNTIGLPLRIREQYRDVQAEVRFVGDRAIVLVDSPSRLLSAGSCNRAGI